MDDDQDFFIQDSGKSLILRNQGNLEFSLSEIEPTLAGLSTIRIADVHQDGLQNVFWNSIEYII